MPWRAGRRWWCGCDGSGVRRRVRGRRGWRGGVGCGWHRFTHWAVAVPGVVAVLPGAVAPDELALVGLAQGLGGGACVGGAHGSGRCLDALVDESSGVGDGQVLRSVVAVVVPGPRGRRRRGACAARIACSRAPSTKSAPRAAAGGPATGRKALGAQRRPVRLPAAQPTIRRENRPRDEGGAAEPRPGRHAGEVDHPAPVWAGGGGSLRRSGPSGDRVPLGGPGGAHRPARPGAGRTPAPACAAPAARAGHPGALPPGARQPPGLPGIPGARVEAARPPGARILIAPGRRPRSTSWRAGGTGRRNRWTGRSCTPTRSGRCRPGTGPAAPPLRWSMHSADQRDGRSHCAAMDKPTRSARSRPPPAAPGSSGRFPGAGMIPHPSMDSDPPPHPGRSTRTSEPLACARARDERLVTPRRASELTLGVLSGGESR